MRTVEFVLAVLGLFALVWFGVFLGFLWLFLRAAETEQAERRQFKAFEKAIRK